MISKSLIKATASLGVIFISYLFGKEINLSKKREIDLLSDMADIIGDIISKLKYLCEDVFDICQSVFSTERRFDFEAFKRIECGNFKDEWEKSCVSLKDFCDNETYSLFLCVGEILGASTSEVQIEKLSYIRSKLEDILALKKEKYLSNEKISLSLSVGLGFVLVLIFI